METPIPSIGSNPRDLAGKVAIVTGGAQRIGRAIALRLAASGASIVVNARPSGDRARAVGSEAHALGGAPRVRVHCLAPGLIEDPDDDAAAKAGRRKSYPVERIPAGRPGRPDEIAEGVAMLCSPRSRFLTGQILHLNGGMYLGA